MIEGPRAQLVEALRCLDSGLIAQAASYAYSASISLTKRHMNYEVGQKSLLQEFYDDMDEKESKKKGV